MVLETNGAGALTRRAVVLGALGGLAACATGPVVLDRASMAGVRRIAVPTVGFPVSPVVDVTNGVGKRLGLIGAVTTAVVFRNRIDALKSIMLAQGFDAREYFVQDLATQVRAMGYDVVAGAAADPTRRSFLDSAASPVECDAVLDVFVGGYGLVANSDRDDDPYKPAAAAGMRLVSTRDRSVLMQDRVLFTGIDALMARPDGLPAPIAFGSFSEVTADPGLAVAALRGALDYTAASVRRRLT